MTWEDQAAAALAEVVAAWENYIEAPSVGPAADEAAGRITRSVRACRDVLRDRVSPAF